MTETVLKAPPKKTRIRAAGTDRPVPRTDAEAETAIARLGMIQREQAMLQATHDGAIAETIPGIAVVRGPEEFAAEPLAGPIREVA